LPCSLVAATLATLFESGDKIVANRLETEPTFVELIADVAAGAHDLGAAHCAQLRAEVAAELARSKFATMALANGGLVGYIGLAFLCVSLVRVLVEYAGWPDWAAWLLVGGFLCVIGVAITAAGLVLLRSIRIVPDHTIRSVQESLSWISNN
jgi:hypothetical protein